MSSRNRFLTPDARVRARAIVRALAAARAESSPPSAERVMSAILEEGGLTVEYAAVRDARTLLEPMPGAAGRALIAARAGSVRLIDNGPWDWGK